MPLHPTSTSALRRYALTRDHLCHHPRTDRFFLSSGGGPLSNSTVERAFRGLTVAVGLREGSVGPRIHDLRHTFAVRTLIAWQRDGVDIPTLLPLLSTYLGHVEPKNTYWYLSAVPELMQLAAARLEQDGGSAMTALAPVLQAFFIDRLIAQRNASPHTIAGYRDTYRLLLTFAAAKTHKPPSALDISDLDAPLIGAFLTYLERERGNHPRTRNWRLAAIHSLFGDAAFSHPEHAAVIQRVLAIPPKRYQRNVVSWLTEPEADTLLAAPDRGTWTGRRDHALFTLTLQTGLRISEIIGLDCSDLHLANTGANISCTGKGRKRRATPLTSLTVRVLHAWTAERSGQPHEPLFPTRTGGRLSRDAIEHRLTQHLGVATTACPSLTGKHVTMHTLRHTAAMRLLHAGVDIAVIALWLGHEHLATADIYLHADMNQKEHAIAQVTPPGTRPGRYRPPDPLLTFLDTL